MNRIILAWNNKQQFYFPLKIDDSGEEFKMEFTTLKEATVMAPKKANKLVEELYETTGLVCHVFPAA